MKKCIGLAVSFAAVLFLAGCASVDKKVSQNEIMSQKMVVNTYFDRDDFVVLGSVKGESDFVYAEKKSGNAFEIAGDSGKYGYLFEPDQQYVGDKVFLGTGKRAVAIGGDEAFKRAKLNANWQLIENAYAMGADSIIDPVYSVEIEAAGSQELGVAAFSGGTVKYKVTVRAKAIQFKTK